MDTLVRPTRLPALFVAFAGMGITAAAVPATLPAFAQAQGAPLQPYLAAVPALFFGLLVGVLLNSALAGRVSTHALTAVGAAAQALGFGALALAPSADFFIGAAGVVGLGFGIVEAGGSVLARELAGEHTARLLSALTGTVAVAAAVVPLAIGLTALGAHPRAVYVAVAVLHAALAVWWTLDAARRREPRGGRISASAERPIAARLLDRRTAVALAPIAVALLLYVGVETVYAGWSAAIPVQVLAVNAEQAAIGTAVFWALLATGRYFAAYVLGRGVSNRVYLMISATTAAAALAVSAATIATSPAVSIAALAVAVAALGPCYSLILGIGLARVPVAGARRATGVLVACGALGGSLIPGIALLISDDPTAPIVLALTAILTITVGLLVLAGGGAARARRVTDDDRINQPKGS